MDNLLEDDQGFLCERHKILDHPHVKLLMVSNEKRPESGWSEEKNMHPPPPPSKKN